MCGKSYLAKQTHSWFRENLRLCLPNDSITHMTLLLAFHIYSLVPRGIAMAVCASFVYIFRVNLWLQFLD